MPNKTPPHPMQPIYIDEDGIARFKRNAIVCALLDTGKLNMNELAVLDFPQEDREQFAQLIGYSVSGFGELSYTRPETVSKADAEVERLSKRKTPGRKV